MKKIIVIFLIIFVFIVLVINGLMIFLKKEYSYDENTLYIKNFDNVRIRFQHIDDVMPQNQIVAVQKSI